MKKFLTVLLVIAVMFTFSFSSAFAAVPAAAPAKDATVLAAVAGDFYSDWDGTTMNSAYGTLGYTTEQKEAFLYDINGTGGVFDALDGTVYWSGEDYTSYYGSEVDVEGPQTNYVAKVLDQFNNLKTLATRIAKDVDTVTKRTTDSNLLTVIKNAIGDVSNLYGLPYVLNEYDETKNELMSNAEYDELVAVWTEAKETVENATTAYAMAKAIKSAKTQAAKITAKYNAYEKEIVKYAKLTVDASLLDGMYLVPNYGRFVFNALQKNYSLALSTLTPNEQYAVICWFLDNGYTTKASFEEGAAKFVEALVPFKTWSEEYKTDLKALATKIKNVNQSVLLAKSTETKLADVTALYAERDAFLAKYAVTQELLEQITNAGIDIELTGIANALRKEVAATVLANQDAVKALNKVRNTMTAEEKTQAIALANEIYANFNALLKADDYGVMDKIYPIKFNAVALAAYADKETNLLEKYVAGYNTALNLTTVLIYAGDFETSKLMARISEFMYVDIQDVADAIEDFQLFTVDETAKTKAKGYKWDKDTYHWVDNIVEDGVNYNWDTTIPTRKNGTSTGLAFDASSYNLAAIKAAREAVDGYFTTYGDLVYEFVNPNYVWDSSETPNNIINTDEDYNAPGKYGDTVKMAAKLLAAEYNAKAITDKDAKTKADKVAAIQASLDNAKVTVKTQALGQGKIRVQATIDAATWANINDFNDELNANYTVTYKFYKKKATAKKYTGYSDRTANYTTFKGLKKGTKYQFKCAVVVKDAKGNVVATRPFSGSTTGVRTAK